MPLRTNEAIVRKEKILAVLRARHEGLPKHPLLIVLAAEAITTTDESLSDQATYNEITIQM